MADQPQQTNPNEHRYYPEDEIELMDYLLVIWKWKYLILAGTVICALIAYIISFTTPKPANRYRVDMILAPGVINIDKKGREVFIDSAQNIKALIESGAFNTEILSNLKSLTNQNAPTALQFKVDIQKNTNLMKISYETHEDQNGIKILAFLSKALLANHNGKIKLFHAKV